MTLEEQAIKVIRGLSMDAPRAARSGHQGTAMALAPLAHVLWTRVMTYDAEVPDWPDADRFVLSAGHASILLYSMLHLTGGGLSLDDLRDFRQWGSATPGHPECNHTPGVAVTTGPLGQGVANGVGMGIAEEWLRAEFGADLCDHHTFVVCGDGDLSEGISHEAASLAGHLELGRLVYVYDDNHISIDGPTELSLSDDAVGRFKAYGWHVEDLGEVANDLDALEAGLRRGMAEEGRPSLLVLRSHIGYPSPKHTDSAAAHGNPFDDEEIAVTKELMGLPPDQTFFVPDEVLGLYREAGRRGRPAREAWEKRLADTDDRRGAFEAALAGHGTPGWADALPVWEVGEQVATRKASNACLNAALAGVPGLMGGGADLTGNTGTQVKDAGVFGPDERTGRQIYWGVREHGMGGVMNGMALHGGVLPIGGTFLVFSDYMRPAVRLAAMSDAHVIYSWSHDSVGVGEDGPTHQPVEQVAALRAIPNLCVIRPADANETAAAWRVAVEVSGPVALILSRQDLPVLEGTADAPVGKGAYVLAGPEAPDLVLVGTGSEVEVCLAAAEVLAGEGIGCRVVSMPSWDRFAAQDDTYRRSVIPAEVPSLSVEAGVRQGWERWVDAVHGLDRFGASAPGAEALDRLGFNPEAVADSARRLLAGSR